MKMDKMISINHEIINRQGGNCWETYKFRSIKISGNRNQCLQYCLHSFYHDVDNF